MQNKYILSFLLVAVALLVFVAASLMVFAIGVGGAAAQTDNTITIEAVEAAPVQAAPAVIESRVKYEGFSAGGGCMHSARMQMTYKSDKETIETPNDQLLTQVQR
jgi:type IV secretory pathway TrbL component